MIFKIEISSGQPTKATDIQRDQVKGHNYLILTFEKEVKKNTEYN